MKSTLQAALIVNLLLTSFTVSAQHREASPSPSHQFPLADGINDTLGWWQFTSGTQVLYNSPNGGYVFGTNGYIDLEKARSFVKDDTSSVDEALLLFGAKNLASGDATSHIRVVIYRPDSVGYGVIGLRVGAPGTEMGSVNVLVSDIDTSGGFTSVDLSGINFDTTSFLISIDMSTMAIGDTIGLISTTDGDAGEDEVAWERQSDGTWVTMLESNIGWDLDCHPGIFCVLNAMEVGLESANLRNLILWPNPVVDRLNVVNPMESSISVQIVSMDSKLLYQEVIGARRTESIDLSHLDTGTYILRSISGSSQTSQMIIIH